jgi:hypothetical protein
MLIRRLFVLGRRSRGSTTLIVLRVGAAGPIVGPWTLKAVVSHN